MIRKIPLLLLTLLLTVSAQAEVWQARYGVAETFNFKLYNADGTLDTDETDGGTEVSLSCNEGAEATATNDFVDEGTFYSIALTAAELQCERVAVVVAATTTEVFFIQTSANASAMTPSYEANVGTITAGAITAAAVATDAIDADAVANDAIDAGAIAASAIGTSELATGAITTAEFAAGAIDAAAIAANAIDAATFAADVDAEFLSYIVDDATRIDASELNGDIDSLTFTVAGDVDANMQGISGDTGAADTLETAFDLTTGPVSALGIARQGTAQSATATTLVLDASAPFADDVPIGMTIVACGSTQGYCQSESVTDYTTADDTVTVNTWPVTPSGTITYYLFATAPASGGGGGSGATAQEVWEYATRSLTILDEDSTTMDLNATAVGAAASVTGAVGSVTGNVGGNVTGSVGSVATGGITTGSFAAGAINAAAIATDAIGAAEIASAAIAADEIAADAIGASELAAGAITSSEIATDAIDADAIAADAITTSETGVIDVNVEQMNGNDVCGTGDAGTPWTGCP